MYKKGDIVYLDGIDVVYVGIVLEKRIPKKGGVFQKYCGWKTEKGYISVRHSISSSMAFEDWSNHTYVMFGDLKGWILTYHLYQK